MLTSWSLQSTPAESVDHPLHPVHDQLAEIVRSGAGKVIVDLGCGPGGSLAAIAARGAAEKLQGRLGEAAQACEMIRASAVAPQG